MLEELLAHLKELFKSYGILLHVIVALLEELVKIVVDFFSFSAVHIDDTLVEVIFLRCLLLVYFHLRLFLFLLGALETDALGLLGVATFSLGLLLSLLFGLYFRTLT